MTASLTKIAGSFPKACRTVVFCKSEAVGLGHDDFDDMIAVKPLRKSVSATSIFIDGKPAKHGSPSPSAIYKNYRSLLDKGSVGSFSLPKKTADQLKRACKKLDATHIRFHSRNDGIHIAAFDLRRFIPEMRLKRKHEVLMVTDTISSQERYRFSVTISASTFCTLPVADSQVTVDPLGIVKFTFSDGSFYLFRDQKIVPPLLTTTSVRLGKDIVLWLHPKSELPNLRTTL